VSDSQLAIGLAQPALGRPVFPFKLAQDGTGHWDMRVAGQVVSGCHDRPGEDSSMGQNPAGSAPGSHGSCHRQGRALGKGDGQPARWRDAAVEGAKRIGIRRTVPGEEELPDAGDLERASQVRRRLGRPGTASNSAAIR
jgi:hypothetical protein